MASPQRQDPQPVEAYEPASELETAGKPGSAMNRAVNGAGDALAGLGKEILRTDLRGIPGGIGGYIRQQRQSAEISLRELAKTAGVSNPYLSQIERGLRKPSAEILQQIARGLRISAEALYVQAGILEPHQGGALTSSVLADQELTERQKQVLLDIYESFRSENAERSSQNMPVDAQITDDQPDSQRPSQSGLDKEE